MARTAAVNIIPTSTGAARAAGLVVPSLAGRLDGLALRVPVEDGSLTDLTVLLDREVTVDEVNAAFRAAAETTMAGILRYSTAPLVSRDVIGDPASCIFDSAAHPGVRATGEGVRLVRQRVGLLRASGRPRGTGRQGLSNEFDDEPGASAGFVLAPGTQGNRDLWPPGEAQGRYMGPRGNENLVAGLARRTP